MPRVVLLLPTATYRAPDFVAAARAVGAEVVVACDRPQALEGVMASRALTVDLSDPAAAADAVVAAASANPVAAVVAVDDAGVLTAARAAARLGLRHNPVDAVAATRDKAILRAALEHAGIPQPHWEVVPPATDVGPAAAKVGYPCVVKPVSRAGSQGVIRADDEEAARAAAQRVRAISGVEPLVVESFVPGAEVAVEGLLRDGALDVLAVFDKPDPLDGPYFEETLYVTPSRHPDATVRAVHELVAAACRALGLVEGPVHAEARLPPDGAPVLLEVAARTIGGLCSRTLRFGLGTSLEEIVLRHALGLPIRDLQRERTAAGVMMLPIHRRGVLRGVHGADAARTVTGVVGLEITIPVGKRVEPLPEGDRYLGFLFARGDTAESVERSLRDGAAILDIVID